MIYSPKCIDGEWKRRSNDELYGLYSDLSRRVKVQRHSWLLHLERMDNDAPDQKVFDSIPEGRSVEEEEEDHDINGGLRYKRTFIETASQGPS